MPKNKKLCPSEQHVEMITFCACTRGEMMENVDVLMQLEPEFVRSVLVSFALPVRDVWLIKIFQFLFLILLLLLLFVVFIVAQLTKMHFIFGFWDSSRERVIALAQINTFHAIYLLTWMVFFVKQILDMMLYIVYFVLVSFFWFFLSPLLRQSFLDIYLYQIGTGSSDTYDEISYNKLNQSSFCVLNVFSLTTCCVSEFFIWRCLIMKTWIVYKWQMEFVFQNLPFWWQID